MNFLFFHQLFFEFQTSLFGFKNTLSYSNINSQFISAFRCINKNQTVMYNCKKWIFFACCLRRRKLQKSSYWKYLMRVFWYFAVWCNFETFLISLKSNLSRWFFSIIFISFLYAWINQKTYDSIVRIKLRYTLLIIINSMTSCSFFKMYNWMYLFNHVSILCLLIDFFLDFCVLLFKIYDSNWIWWC